MKFPSERSSSLLNLYYVVHCGPYIADVEPAEGVAALEHILLPVAVHHIAALKAAEGQPPQVVPPAVLLHRHFAPGGIQRRREGIAAVVGVYRYGHIHLAPFQQRGVVVGGGDRHIGLQCPLHHIETAAQDNAVGRVLRENSQHIIARCQEAAVLRRDVLVIVHIVCQCGERTVVVFNGSLLKTVQKLVGFQIVHLPAAVAVPNAVAVILRLRPQHVEAQQQPVLAAQRQHRRLQFHAVLVQRRRLHPLRPVRVRHHLGKHTPATAQRCCKQHNEHEYNTPIHQVKL